MTRDLGPTPKIPFVEALRVEMTGRAHSQMLPPLVEIIDVGASPAIPELPDYCPTMNVSKWTAAREIPSG